jgi:hypothetical protein
MSTLSNSDLDKIKKKAVKYIETSVYMLSTFLGIDPSEISSSSSKPNWLLGETEEEAYNTLIRQVKILERLRNET